VGPLQGAKRSETGRGLIAGLILGRVLKIRKLMFYSSANDSVKLEFANDLKYANAPSLVEAELASSLQLFKDNQEAV